MDENRPEKNIATLSMTEIIDLIRQNRIRTIKKYLYDHEIQLHFKIQFEKEKISPVKIEFLKRDLNELLISPVDLVYYASVINDIKESNNVDLLDDSNHSIVFQKEIDAIFKKYIY